MLAPSSCARRSATTTQAPAAAPLELLSLTSTRRGAELSVAGLVRNPSTGGALERVAAVVLFFDERGGFLTSARAPLDVAVDRARRGVPLPASPSPRPTARAAIASASAPKKAASCPTSIGVGRARGQPGAADVAGRAMRRARPATRRRRRSPPAPHRGRAPRARGGRGRGRRRHAGRSRRRRSRRPSGSFNFRSRAELINVTATVTDRSERFVSGLRQRRLHALRGRRAAADHALQRRARPRQPRPRRRRQRQHGRREMDRGARRHRALPPRSARPGG